MPARQYRKFRRRRVGAGMVPTDSFSDIAFLLIIFFMIATTMIKTKGFQTDLPAGKESQETSEQKVPHINMHGDIMMYNETQVDLDQLRKTLFELQLWTKPEQQRMVKLEASDNVAYKNYYPVWAAVVRAGGVVAIVEAEK